MPLVKFSSQADSHLLECFKIQAKKEGRQLQSLLDEAMQDLLEKRRSGNTRPHVMTAFNDSLNQFDSLYEKLAK